MKRNKMFVVGVLAATFLLLPTGLQSQEDGDHHCSRENCVLGSFSLIVQATGLGTFKALLTLSPGGGAVETNTAQGAPVTVHGSWAATKDDQIALTFITFSLRGPGMAKTRETINFSDSGDSFTAVFVVQEMDANGNVFATVPGTATGKRIFVEPLSD